MQWQELEQAKSIKKQTNINKQTNKQKPTAEVAFIKQETWKSEAMMGVTAAICFLFNV